MHELALTNAIVDTVVRHAEGRRVSGVRMRIGALRQVVPDSLAFYFEIVSRDTVCAEARLEYELVPALLTCPACGERWDPAPPAAATQGAEIDALGGLPTFRCPGCRAGGGEVLRGDELEVEFIEIEAGDAEEEPCTAPR